MPHKLLMTMSKRAADEMVCLHLAFLLIVHLLIGEHSVAASLPILICENENARAEECSNEKLLAAAAVAPWFTSFSQQSTRKDRRMLVDCTRFCHKADHFTLHAPCDCNTRRYLQGEPENSSNNSGEATWSVTALPEGPIQVLNEFISSLPGGRCKDEVFSRAKCMVNFVSSYNHDQAALDKEDEADDEELESAGTIVDMEVFDPQTNTTVGNGETPVIEISDEDIGSIVETVLESEQTPTSEPQDMQDEVSDPVLSPDEEIESDVGNPQDTGSIGSPGDIVEAEIFDPKTNETTTIPADTLVTASNGGTQNNSMVIETETTLPQNNEPSGPVLSPDEEIEPDDADSLGDLLETATWDPSTDQLTEQIFSPDTSTPNTTDIDGGN